MCLYRIKTRRLNWSGTGWKIFNLRNEKLVNLFYPAYKVIINKWLESKRVRVYSSNRFKAGRDYLYYMSGFHILLEKPDKATASYYLCNVNLPYEVRRVKYTRGKVLGADSVGREIVVADRMLVLPEGVK